MATLETVGFVGLGQMGMGMARNLVAAGHDVLAYDVAPATLDAFTAHGGRAARDPAQVGAECRSVIIIVSTGAQVDTVVNGPRGLLQAMGSGTIVVSSTISLEDIRRIGADAAARGVAMLDCPVSGGIPRARDGTLAMLCGGERAAFDAHLPLLQRMASEIAYLGPLGSAMVGKQANNLICGIGRIAIAEAMGMAKKAGVPLDTLYAALKTCSGDSYLLRVLEKSVLRGEYPVVTPAAMKDLGAALETGRSVQQAMPATSLALELYRLADAKLGGLRCSDEVVRFLMD